MENNGQSEGCSTHVGPSVKVCKTSTQAFDSPPRLQAQSPVTYYGFIAFGGRVLTILDTPDLFVNSLENGEGSGNEGTNSGQAPPEKVEQCPRCRGRGWVVTDKPLFGRCPDCRGTGRLSATPPPESGTPHD